MPYSVQTIARGHQGMGSNNIDALVARALDCHRRNQIEEAESVYNQILVLDPENADALHLKGAVAIQRGDYRRAVELISRAIVIRPDESAFYSNLAVALERLGLADKAQHYAERALSLKMDSAESYVVLGQSLNRQNRSSEALEKFQVALKLQPENVAAVNGVLHILANAGEHSEIETFAESRLARGKGADDLLIRLAAAKRALGKFDDALACLDMCKHKAGHDWNVHSLKTKIDKRDFDGARVHGQEILLIKDKIARLIMPDGEAEAITQRWPQTFRVFDSSSPHRNIVCFSLWGDDKKYTYTAVLNAKLTPSIYPGWKARFYIDESVPSEIAQALHDYGAQVVMVQRDERTYLKLFWRFLAASDRNIDYFICRDCDSVINKKEKAAVDDWLASGKPFHIMRDHPEHAELIMAGMWGGVAGLLPDLAAQAVTYYEAHETKWRWVDQDFLRDHVWPLVRLHAVTHDSQYLFGSDARPFPEGVELPDGDHVGGYMPANWTVRS
jgi:Flp pilus assembly protein TadD